MGKIKNQQLLLGKNNIRVSLFFVLSSLFFTSCIFSEANNNRKVVDRKTISTTNKATLFEPDSTINHVLKLSDSKSSYRFYPNIDKVLSIDSLRECPVKLFSNKAHTEYLMVYQYEGGVSEAFDFFEFGYLNKNLKRKATVVDNVNIFKTESGLKLGMSKGDLIKIKGEDYTIVNDSILKYEINNYSTSEFLKKYNMPAYYLECTFRKSKAVKIKFGFENP